MGNRYSIIEIVETRILSPITTHTCLVRGRSKGGRSEEFRMNIIVEDITVARMRSRVTEFT